MEEKYTPITREYYVKMKESSGKIKFSYETMNGTTVRIYEDLVKRYDNTKWKI